MDDSMAMVMALLMMSWEAESGGASSRVSAMRWRASLAESHHSQYVGLWCIFLPSTHHP
jgi:hypothetical protein